MLQLVFDYGKVTIGNNAIENWEIISITNRNALWFHINKKPSIGLLTMKRCKPKCAII